MEGSVMTIGNFTPSVKMLKIVFIKVKRNLTFAFIKEYCNEYASQKAD